MSSQLRIFIESPIEQGEDEEIAYSLDTLPYGGSPSSVSAVVKNSEGDDVSATVLDGSPSVNGDTISLPTLKNLTAGARYRYEVLFTSGGNIFEAWGRIVGEV